MINWWVRGCCQYGVMPCNGLIYSPPHPCRCFFPFKFDGFHALSGRNSLDEIAADDATRLQEGPAYGSISRVFVDMPMGPPGVFETAAEQPLWASPLGADVRR